MLDPFKNSNQTVIISPATRSEGVPGLGYSTDGFSEGHPCLQNHIMGCKPPGNVPSVGIGLSKKQPPSSAKALSRSR